MMIAMTKVPTGDNPPTLEMAAVNRLCSGHNDDSYSTAIRHHHHHIYFRLPERPQTGTKPIELATIKQQKENCKNEKK